MWEQKLREAFKAGLEKGDYVSKRVWGIAEDEYINSVRKEIELKELSTWDSRDTVVKEVGIYGRTTMLEPTARNMHLLMLKINELVELVNELKK